MTEAETVTGKVARVTEWKRHKGYFLNLKDDSNDYYSFGKCKADVNDTIELEVSEGTGNFSDKIKIDKMHSNATVKQVREETKDKDLEIVKKSIESGENTYFARQNLIIRQTCIKSASRMIAAQINQGGAMPDNVWATKTSDIADMLYAWVTESDQRLPEPPEEP